MKTIMPELKGKADGKVINQGRSGRAVQMIFHSLHSK